MNTTTRSRTGASSLRSVMDSSTGRNGALSRTPPSMTQLLRSSWISFGSTRLAISDSSLTGGKAPGKPAVARAASTRAAVSAEPKSFAGRAAKSQPSRVRLYSTD